jgi:uncharacterized protein
MWREPVPLLVVSVSGRALACATRRAGLTARVVDLFADGDTRACAELCEVVAQQGAGPDPHAVLAAAARLAPSGSGHGVLYGSGFEHCPEVLDALAEGRELLGNDAETVRRVKDPQRFFGLLSELGIPHPPTRTLPPAAPQEGWLTKRIGGSGGGHVRPLESVPVPLPLQGVYYQQRVEGRPYSVLFLADGRRARIVGYNEQWAAAGIAGRPYLYGGAVALASAPAGLEPALTGAVAALVQATGLRGLCGLDFIHDGRDFHVVEVNPRPSATFDLHDGPESLVRAHIDACRGHLPRGLAAPRASQRAHALVYAPRRVRIAADVRWPEWVADRPQPGAVIDQGQPVCTVYAETPDAAATRRLVQARRQWLQGGTVQWLEAA